MTTNDALITRQLPAPEDTDRLGGDLARAVSGAAAAAAIAGSGLAVRLEGDLGAGKTTLTRAFLRALGFEGPVKSPTFSLLELYDVAAGGEGFEVDHFDFYRFEEPLEFEDAGFRDYFAPGHITFTEWSEKAEPYLPAADMTVSLAHDGLGRTARIEAHTRTGRLVLENLADACASADR